MEKIRQDIIDTPEYQRFSDDNQKLISDLISKIKIIIEEMENSGEEQNKKIDQLFTSININNAVLTHFKKTEGIELIQKLRAVTEKYRRNCRDNSQLLDSAEHLLFKLDRFKTVLFQTVDTEHLIETEPQIAEIKYPESGIQDLPFKWITFNRNHSSFITDFTDIKILDYKSIPEKGIDYINYKGNNLTVTDLMKSPDGRTITPEKIIILDSGERVFAADHTGKEIRAAKDFLISLIQPLDFQSSHYAGRVRLFGTRYLVISRNI